jgi:hypothetical protein
MSHNRVPKAVCAKPQMFLLENGVFGNYGDSVFRWVGMALIEKS